MRNPSVPLALMAACASAASALEVAHEPVTCAAPGGYVRIAARAVPPEGAVSGQVRFRAGTSDWYDVRMSPVDGEWRAHLPRPLAALPRFEYQVVLAAGDAASASGAPVVVEVRSDCGHAGVAVADAISVRVPPGAPLVPPVPPGFSPIGVTGPAVAKSSHRGLKILAGTAVASGGAGLAAAVGTSTSPESSTPVFPSFAFDGTVPAPGSTLNPRDGLTVFVRMSPQPDRPLQVPWAVHLLSAGGATCASTYARVNAMPSETRLALHAPIMSTSAACGTAFDVEALRLVVGSVDFDAPGETLPLKFRYER